MAAGDYLAIPAAAAGIDTTSDVTTAWVDGAETTLAATNAITTPFAIVGLWVNPIDSAGPDTTYMTIFRLFVAGVEKAVLPFSWRTDTAVGFYSPRMLWLAEPYAANANESVTIKSASSTLRTYRVKLLYRELSAAAVAGHVWRRKPAHRFLTLR